MSLLGLAVLLLLGQTGKHAVPGVLGRGKNVSRRARVPFRCGAAGAQITVTFPDTNFNQETRTATIGWNAPAQPDPPAAPYTQYRVTVHRTAPSAQIITAGHILEASETEWAFHLGASRSALQTRARHTPRAEGGGEIWLLTA